MKLLATTASDMLQSFTVLVTGRLFQFFQCIIVGWITLTISFNNNNKSPDLLQLAAQMIDVKKLGTVTKVRIIIYFVRLSCSIGILNQG